MAEIKRSWEMQATEIALGLMVLLYLAAALMSIVYVPYVIYRLSKGEKLNDTEANAFVIGCCVLGLLVVGIVVSIFSPPNIDYSRVPLSERPKSYKVYESAYQKIKTLEDGTRIKIAEDYAGDWYCKVDESDYCIGDRYKKNGEVMPRIVGM